MNREINIPTFKLKHLLLTILVLVLLVLNLTQWYFNKDNHILDKQYKAKEKSLKFKIDSISAINKKYDDSVKIQNKIIDILLLKKTAEKDIRKTINDDFKKRKKHFDNLSNTVKYDSVTNILSKYE